MEQAKIVMETPLGEVIISGGYTVVMEVQRRCNRFDTLAEALTAWQVLAEESLPFRLALTDLPHEIGCELLARTQAALLDA